MRGVCSKRLTGLELPAIGDQHEYQDKVMMIEGKVKVEEIGAARIKVAGNGRAAIRGPVYHVSGWIEISTLKSTDPLSNFIS